jgi:ankyrin repeat protein
LNDGYGRTPLWWAARNGHEGIVKLQLEAKADIDVKDKDGGWMPFWWAALNKYESIVKILLEAKADVESTDKHGQTPLLWAAQNGPEGVIKLLLERVMRIEEVEFDMLITTCSLRFYIIHFSTCYDKLERIIRIKIIEFGIEP